MPPPRILTLLAVVLPLWHAGGLLQAAQEAGAEFIVDDRDATGVKLVGDWDRREVSGGRSPAGVDGTAALRLPRTRPRP